MSFDLTTFVLEMINFLVLLWLLQRFLYKPILKVINDRQSAIDKKLADAQNGMTAAAALKEQYGKRLEEWEKERFELASSLKDELQSERLKQLAKVKEEIQEEQKRAKALAEVGRLDEIKQCQEQALELAAQFTEKLLARFKSPELEKRILEIFLEEFPNFSKDHLRSFNGNSQSKDTVQVTTAYPLPAELKESIEMAIVKQLGRVLPLKFAEDPSLIAGIKLMTSAGVCQINLQDALAFFRDCQGDGGTAISESDESIGQTGKTQGQGNG